MKVLAIAVIGVVGLALGGRASAAELKVGDPAPDFTLQATDGKTYKLSDFKGKQAVVVAWFPRAFTQGCTIECKSLAENGDKIRKFDVTYFMASVDPLEDNTKCESHQVKLGENMVDKKEADFPLLSDPTKATATAYGVLNERGLRKSLDVLHRQGRKHRGHRDHRPAGHVSGRHDREAGRASRRPSEVVALRGVGEGR